MMAGWGGGEGMVPKRREEHEPYLYSLSYLATQFFLFDLILYVHSTIFQLCGTGLPGLNQY